MAVVQWRVIAYVLGDMTEQDEAVPDREIYAHPIMQAWYAQSKSSPSSHVPQINRRLQERTSRSSTTVGSEPRFEPSLFDKTTNARWYLTPEGRDYLHSELIPNFSQQIESEYGASEKLSNQFPNSTENEEDEEYSRETVMRAIQIRRGQPRFRRKLLAAYEGVCAVTSSNATEALEAAHIHAVSEGGSMRVSNGLLLRADIHTLFDLGLITIHPESLRIELSEILRDSDYAFLHQKKLGLPDSSQDYPSAELLIRHYAESRERRVYR
jgi:predicted restriction endonuclease